MNQVLRVRINAGDRAGGTVIIWRCESRLKREEHIYVAHSSGLEPIALWQERELRKQTNGNSAGANGITQAGEEAEAGQANGNGKVCFDSEEFRNLLSSLNIVPIS